MDALLFIVGVLATWRITYMVLNEAAPFDLLGKFRYKLGVGEYEGTRPDEGSLRQLFSCFKCLSIWAALPFALLIAWGDWWWVLPYDLAISGLAIFVQAYAERQGM